jgi:hypothetical protein
MRRETTFVASNLRKGDCLNPVCDRDAVRESGYCDPCNQAILRRIRAGKYTREELIARGKLLVPAIDAWLQQ